MGYLLTHTADILTLLFVGLLIGLCIRNLIKDRKAGRTCGGCSHNCATCVLARLHGKIS